MRLLLTSGGLTNPSIRQALDDLLGKPVGECALLVVPTASHALPGGGQNAWRTVAGHDEAPFVGLGWASVGVLELTALPTLPAELWQPAVREADVLFVAGGDPMYLHHWMRESGLAELLPELDDLVYVGLSAGSMVLTPRIGADFVMWEQPAGGDATLGVVDFSLFPHLGHPQLTENTMAAAEEWSAGLGNAAYAIDDDTAIRVVDGVVDVVSEGSWRHLPG